MWLTALRFQVRQMKGWENVITKAYNQYYLKCYSIAQWKNKIKDELKSYLSKDEMDYSINLK